MNDLHAGDIDRLVTTARHLRASVIEMSHRAQTPHLASALSCIDILVSAYWGGLAVDPTRPDDPDRDRFILSKGHAATALYSALALRGYFPVELLATFNTDGGRLAEHPGPHCVPGVEAATGSLGHGLGLALGMAFAARLQGRKSRVFALISDGECNEGSTWEAALLAPAMGLDRVAVIVDYNKWQATGRSEEVTALRPLREKWAAFGWNAIEVDGHDHRALLQALRAVPDGSGKPLALVAHTVKGKGVSFMEDDNNWHYRVPNAEEVRLARQELQLA